MSAASRPSHCSRRGHRALAWAPGARGDTSARHTIAAACAAGEARPRPSNAPPTPQLVYRTASEVCLRPKAFQPIKKPGMVEAPRVASYAVYGKAAGASGQCSFFATTRINAFVSSYFDGMSTWPRWRER